MNVLWYSIECVNFIGIGCAFSSVHAVVGTRLDWCINAYCNLHGPGYWHWLSSRLFMVVCVYLLRHNRYLSPDDKCKNHDVMEAKASVIAWYERSPNQSGAVLPTALSWAFGMMRSVVIALSSSLMSSVVFKVSPSKTEKRKQKKNENSKSQWWWLCKSCHQQSGTKSSVCCVGFWYQCTVLLRRFCAPAKNIRNCQPPHPHPFSQSKYPSYFVCHSDFVCGCDLNYVTSRE